MPTDPFFSLYDLAYHYDALSILQVKASRPMSPGTRAKVEGTLDRFHEVLGTQVGVAYHDTILASPEYAEMVRVNDWLFDAFDWLHSEGLSAPAEQVKAKAIETDRVNGVDRPAAKRALQARWFGEVSPSLQEVKLGYGEGAA